MSVFHPSTDPAMRSGVRLAAASLGMEGHSPRRLIDLCEIGALFVGYENVERTVDRALTLATRTLPLLSAVLIEEDFDCIRTVMWSAQGREQPAHEAARAHAHAMYGRLRAPHELLPLRVTDETGRTSFALTGPSDARGPAVVLPLVRSAGQVFGALQFEISGLLDEADVRFVGAVATQLGTALDRRQVWARAVRRGDAAEAETERLRAETDLLRRILGGLQTGVLATDLDRRVIFLNTAAARILEPLIGPPAHGAILRPELLFRGLVGHAGARIDAGAHHGVHLHPSGSPLSYTVGVMHRDGAPSGSVVELEVRAPRAPHRAMQRYMIEASRILGAELDDPDVFTRFARLLVPRLGDQCFVDVAIDGGLARVGSADAAAVSTPSPPRALYLPTPLAEHPAAEALRTGRTQVIDGVDAWARATPMAASHRDALLALTPRTLVMIPMRLGGATIGALTLVFSRSGRQHDPADIPFAEELAEQVAHAQQNRRLFEEAVGNAQKRRHILGVVAHDLRNPLSAIKMTHAMFAETTEPAGRDREAYETTVALLGRSLERAQHLVDDLIDVVAIEAGRLSVALHPVDTAALLSDVRAASEPLAATKRVRVLLASDPDLPLTCGDHDRLVQVAVNVVGNAIKVSRPTAAVTLGATVRHGEVVFSVTDTGPGISPRDCEHLFEPYWRSVDAKYSGTGLGLAIAKGIIAAHGGRIWVESVLGAGTTFFFTVPVHDSGRVCA